MAGPVGHRLALRRRQPQLVEDQVCQFLDAGLHAGADVVRLADPPACEHRVDRPAVVESVNPLAPVAAGGVHGQGLPVDRPGGEQRQHLLRELVGPVVVGAVGEGHRQPEGLVVRAYGVVRARLGGVVGGTGAVRRLLGERLLGVQGQVPVHLAGGDVVETLHVGPPARVEEHLGAQHVGAEEPSRIQHGEAVVRLGGEVHHHLDLMLGEDLRGVFRVSDVPADQSDPVGHVGQVLLHAGVGECVEGHHGVLGVVLGPVPGEVRTDETRGSGDKQ